MSKVCWEALKIESVPPNPCSPRGGSSPPKLENLYNVCDCFSTAIGDAISFLWENIPTTEAVAPRLILP